VTSEISGVNIFYTILLAPVDDLGSPYIRTTFPRPRSTLKMEAEGSSETLLAGCQTARRCIPEDSTLHSSDISVLVVLASLAHALSRNGPNGPCVVPHRPCVDIATAAAASYPGRPKGGRPFGHGAVGLFVNAPAASRLSELQC
jgi:hypothetical protein